MELSYATNQNSSPAQGISPRDEQSICTNIGPAEQSRRFRFGIITLAIGLGLAALLIATGVNHWWRLLLFLPFAGGASGYFQARDKT